MWARPNSQIFVCVCVHKHKHTEERSENFLSEGAGGRRGKEDVTVQCRGEEAFPEEKRQGNPPALEHGSRSGTRQLRARLRQNGDTSSALPLPEPAIMRAQTTAAGLISHSAAQLGWELIAH